MTDREKVVEIFSELRNFTNNDVHQVVSPENWHVYSELRDLIDEAEADTLALLKEQKHERLKVNIRHRNNDGYCPSCGKCIVMDFCPNNCGFCGQAVKWND